MPKHVWLEAQTVYMYMRQWNGRIENSQNNDEHDKCCCAATEDSCPLVDIYFVLDCSHVQRPPTLWDVARQRPTTSYIVVTQCASILTTDNRDDRVAARASQPLLGT